MSHGKSLRFLAGAALVGAVLYAAIFYGSRGRGGDPALNNLVVAREVAAGLAAEDRFDEAYDLLVRIAAVPEAVPQDDVNVACVVLKRLLTPEAQDVQATRGDADAAAKAAAAAVRAFVEVRERCARALARAPDLATAHYLLGVVAFDKEQDYVQARDHFARAAASAPGDTQVHVRLADALSELGDRDAAIEQYDIVARRGLEYGGTFYWPAIHRLSGQLRRRRKEGDVERASVLTEEHVASGASSQKTSPEVLQLGQLGLVPRARPSAYSGTAPAGAPPVSFIAVQPGLSADAGAVRSLDLTDVNDDRREDLVIAGDRGLFLATQDEAGHFAARKLLDGTFAHVLALELESDMIAHEADTVRSRNLLAIGPAGVRLLEPAAGDGWSDASGQWPDVGPVADVVAVDFDHDGHCDLAVATARGPRLVRNGGVPMDPATAERLGSVQLADATPNTAWPGQPCDWIAIEDFDADQDIDLICGGKGGPTTILSNLRKGRFQPVGPGQSGLPAELPRAPQLTDLDHDGFCDLLLLVGAAAWLRNRADGTCTFEAPRLLPSLARFVDRPATLADVDLDGELDLVVVMEDGTVHVRFGSLTDEKGAALATEVRDSHGLAPLLADLDGDGDLDLVTTTAEGIQLWRGAVEGDAGAYLVRLRGRKDNWLGIGTVIEVRCGDRYQRRLSRGRPELFGLGGKAQADVIHLTWPMGVRQYPLQAGPGVEEAGADASAQTDENKRALPPPRVLGGGAGATRRGSGVDLMQKRGLIGSCPFLYTWNGKKYVFVTDVLGATPLGLPFKEGQYIQPDHDELVRIDATQLAPTDGEYRLQLTEELREVTYLDRTQLWVVDHPADVEVHPEERFCFPPFPPQKIHAVRGAVPVVRAVDQAGRDWTDELARIDGVHAAPFRPIGGAYAGVVTAHTFELTLPAAARTAPTVRLLMTGWLEWADASVNMAVDHNGSLAYVPPLISVPDGQGGWRETGPPVGFPTGKTKTMVLDVSALLNRADPRLRIFSTIELYWDAIRVATDAGDAPITVAKLEPKAATLWFRGFSAPQADERPHQPELFDWDRLEPLPRWDQHPGMLTRTGDVLPLLDAIDERFVILSSGDAIDLRFAAAVAGTPLAPPAAGLARTFLLFLDGWAKDADPNTMHSQSVEPLPFHGMSGYPYGADEHYPTDAEHERYRREWNTRPGRRLIERLARPEAQ